MTESDAKYIAAVLDYAGAISIALQQNCTHAYPMIRLQSTHRDKIALVASLIGVAVKTHRGRHSIAIGSGKAQDIIRQLRPHLRLTKAEADKCMLWVTKKPAVKKRQYDQCACGAQMTAGSTRCGKCYSASLRRNVGTSVPVVDAAGKPEIRRAASGDVTTVGNVQTHRMRI